MTAHSVGRPRPAVDLMPAYRPGKGAAQAEAEHGITNAIKLASNENPLPPIQSIVDAVAAAATGANRYADHRATAVRERLATRLDLGVEQVTVGAGSVGLLQQLFLTYVDPGDEVVYPWRSFEVYPVYTQLMAGVAVTTPLTAEHAFDLDAVAAAVTDRTKLVLLATPNNPTGTALSTAEMANLLDGISPGTIVVIDEAYREFLDPSLGDPVRDLIPRYRNVVVTRTFSKAQGMAGIRAGYAIADPEVISAIDKTLFPFAVSALAQVAAIAAIDAEAEIGATSRQHPQRASAGDHRTHRSRLEAARCAGQLRVPADRRTHRRHLPRPRTTRRRHADRSATRESASPSRRRTRTTASCARSPR